MRPAATEGAAHPPRAENTRQAKGFQEETTEQRHPSSWMRGVGNSFLQLRINKQTEPRFIITRTHAD